MTLLIAEDEPDLLAYMHESLSEYFGKVIAATNGQEALEKIREHMPDMLISDVMMPGMDGFELCKNYKTPMSISVTFPWCCSRRSATTKVRSQATKWVLIFIWQNLSEWIY